MQRTVRTREVDGGLEELVGAVGEIHHEAVGPAVVVAGHLAHVAGDGGDGVAHAVAGGVLAEVRDGGLVEVDGDDRGPAARRRDRERTDAGEHVEKAVARLDPLEEPVALGGQPRREVDARQIHQELVAVLAVDGLGRRQVAVVLVVDGEDVPLANPEFAGDLRGAVEHRPGRQIGFEDRRGDGAGPLGVAFVDDDDVADPFERRLETEDVGGRADAAAGGEIAARRLEAVGKRRGVGDGDVERAIAFDDPVVVVQHARGRQRAAGRLAVRAGDGDTRNLHTTRSVGGAPKRDVSAATA